jgi:hypothetical protein
LIDDDLSVFADVKPLNPEFIGDAQTIDQGVILCHIIGSMEVQLNNVKESISFRRDQHYASPNTVDDKGVAEIHAPMLLGDCRYPTDMGWVKNSNASKICSPFLSM